MEDVMQLPSDRVGQKCVRRVFLAHDNAMVRQGIRFVINMQSDLSVCGESDEGSAALDAIVGTQPDVIIADVISEEGSGLDLIKAIHSLLPRVPILVVTMQDERIFAERALRAGASGYLMKAEAIEQVLQALRVVLDGRIYVSATMADHILARRFGAGVLRRDDPIHQLSDRELEIFQLIGTWKGTREIARFLHLSVKTVEYYREQIKRKLLLKTAADLVRAATAWVEKSGSRETIGH
jgi:DNA-binding NarL/FixJ family response regulator